MIAPSQLLGLLGAISAVVALGADGAPITDEASAVEAAKRFLKARCTAATPCKFRPEHEGKQWRVWVQLTRRNSAKEAPRPYPGGTLILYFDEKGTLTRRLEGD
jgi:hypothetical protein